MRVCSRAARRIRCWPPMSALCRASSARAASTSSRRPFPPRRPSRRRAAPRARGGEGGGDESIAELEALLAKPGKRRAKGGGRGVVKRSAGSSAGDGDAPRRMMPSVRASTDVEGEGLPPFWKEAGFEDKGLAGKLYRCGGARGRAPRCAVLCKGRAAQARPRALPARVPPAAPRRELVQAAACSVLRLSRKTPRPARAASQRPARARARARRRRG